MLEKKSSQNIDMKALSSKKKLTDTLATLVDDFGGRCHLELEKLSPTEHESILSESQES